MVKYTYDSWGKVLSITDENGNEITDSFHIGIENSFRCRGVTAFIAKVVIPVAIGIAVGVGIYTDDGTHIFPHEWRWDNGVPKRMGGK